jgi:nicotinamidase-related amidase
VLPLPPHFDAERVPEVWRVPYQERSEQAAGWAAEHGLAPAAEDERRVCLLLVDCQNTFCTPGFELFVPGAVEDSRRLCELLYRNLGSITRVVASLDTHQAAQVFHALFLVDADGRHPEPYTLVSAADVADGRWRVDAAAARSLGLEPEHAAEHLRHYTRALETGGRFKLTVWPYHALLGGIGHALVSAVEEAVFFHALARHSQPELELKGHHPLTEHYSIFGPEVTRGPPRGEAMSGKNAALLDELRTFDAIYVAGQAKSHCVAWSVEDLLAEIDPARVYLLEDCTSPVVVPGVVDYTADADAAFARFAAAGAHVVRSADLDLASV